MEFSFTRRFCRHGFYDHSSSKALGSDHLGKLIHQFKCPAATFKEDSPLKSYQQFGGGYQSCFNCIPQG